MESLRPINTHCFVGRICTTIIWTTFSTCSGLTILEDRATQGAENALKSPIVSPFPINKRSLCLFTQPRTFSRQNRQVVVMGTIGSRWSDDQRLLEFPGVNIAQYNLIYTCYYSLKVHERSVCQHVRCLASLAFVKRLLLWRIKSKRNKERGATSGAVLAYWHFLAVNLLVKSHRFAPWNLRDPKWLQLTVMAVCFQDMLYEELMPKLYWGCQPSEHSAIDRWYRSRPCFGTDTQTYTQSPTQDHTEAREHTDRNIGAGMFFLHSYNYQ